MNPPADRVDCHHPDSRHRHGSRDAYVIDGCRCDKCRQANTQAQRERRRQIAYRRWQPLLDAAPVREHIRALGQRGIGLRRVAELADVPYSTLTTLMHDADGREDSESRRVRRTTAQRILAVPENSDARAAGTRVTALGTRRRIQALVAIGWTLSALADHLDRDATSLRQSLRRESVTSATAAAVTALYDRLWNTPPDESTPTRRRRADEARALARERGWQPPIAWDDIDTDPEPRPPAQNDHVDELDIEILTDRIRTGEHVVLDSGPLRDEIIWRLTGLGYSLPRIADLLAITPRTVSRRRRASRAA